MNVSEIASRQKEFFDSGKTRDIYFRKEQLMKLKAVLMKHEALLYKAIFDDFGKSKYETFETELALIYHEIGVAIRNLKRWSSAQHVLTNLANFPGSSRIIPEPLGTTLIIGAWNYPYQLTLVPLVSAIAAGNTAIVKPSELSLGCSNAMTGIFNEAFPSEYILFVEGGIKETTELLDQKFDKIFFTGSVPVGRIVYQAAAKHLTPVTLELGGKSPVIVLPDCNLKMAAKRVVWGKFLNAGQTCVAPDYILVHKSVEREFLEELRDQILEQYGQLEGFSDNFVRIINQRHFDRLVGLIPSDKIFYGGKANREKLFIEPTLLSPVTFNDKVMEDEIFGPILPVVAFESLDEAIKLVNSRPNPLALYAFTTSKMAARRILKEISFGGGAINDTIMHLTNGSLPFGGVGNSGIGNYHEEAGFKAFSHFKSVITKPYWFEPFLKYLPYTEIKRKILGAVIGCRFKY